MKTNITQTLMDEHQLILRMIALLEQNAPRTAAGEYTNWQFYLDGIDFIRQYADRFHHAKEEDVLFVALVKNGMPREHSPVAAMLIEHEHGRTFVRNLEEAVREAQAGRTERYQAIADNAIGYAELLKEHITKEDMVLYPLAERVLPDEFREKILRAYRAAEADNVEQLSQHYRRIVERYEQE